MSSLVGSVVGALAACGIILLVGATTGAGHPFRGAGRRGSPARSRRAARRRVEVRTIGAGLIVGLLGWVATGLVAVGVLIVGGFLAIPLFGKARADRALLVDRTEALASWAETLRDYVKSHAGLRQAVVDSLSSVDEVIRPEVERLAVDLEAGVPEAALRRFADDVADPVGDLLATALTVALGESGARDLPGLLGQLARDARDEVSGIRRVAVAHEKAFGTARAMAIVVVATAVGMFAVNGDYLRVYRTAAGQVVLLLVAGVALLAVWGLIRMARPVQPLRVLDPSPGSGRR